MSRVTGAFDRSVYPGTRIARLPRSLRPLAVLVRNLLPDGLRRYRYPYRADDLGTIHLGPFTQDIEFEAAYGRVADHWRGGLEDRRWRAWLLSRLARSRAGVPVTEPANFAEFGVYRGGLASIVLATARLAAQQRFFLFDTFSGPPAAHMTERERTGLASLSQETSIADVEELLSPWHSQVSLCAGDVFETLDSVDVGRLGFAHIDINVSAATVRCLEYAYPRLAPGAIVVLDDYGAFGFPEMRQAVDEFFAGRPEEVIALPTSQGLVIRAGTATG